MKNKQITQVIILGTISIIGLIALQAYWVISTWNINESEFNHKVNYGLYNVACYLAEVNESSLPARNIIKRKTQNFYLVNSNTEIDPELLEFFLRRELESLALNIDFEYAIYDCDSDAMIYGNYCSYEPERMLQRNDQPFPSKYEMDSNYYFGIRFPTRSAFLMGKMQLSIIISAILFLTVLFFAYAMYIMLRQKQFSEMQKEFINTMTHEFKTPLSTIGISAEMFRQSPAIQQDERLRKYADIIHEQNQRLNSQVEKVLQIARLERNSFELKKTPVDLNELVRKIGESRLPHITEQGGRLKCDLSPDTPLTVQADSFHLTNVLYSLLDNAIKYSGKHPDIRIRTERTGNEIRIHVVDKGIGIPPEYQKHIFRKFYRVPTGNVHNVKGFGLGLFYAKQICDAHRWKILLDSQPGKGSCITICIPAPDQNR